MKKKIFTVLIAIALMSTFVVALHGGPALHPLDYLGSGDGPRLSGMGDTDAPVKAISDFFNGGY